MVVDYMNHDAPVQGDEFFLVAFASCPLFSLQTQRMSIVNITTW